MLYRQNDTLHYYDFWAYDKLWQMREWLGTWSIRGVGACTRGEHLPTQPNPQ